MSIPVIDLFSGPGGLGEGFASQDDGQLFRIVVSAEMDRAAHSTLALRSYYRRLRGTDTDLQAYYDFCHGAHAEPWNSQTRSAWKEAAEEARQLTLGTSEGNAELDKLLNSRLKRSSECILIGGPPCQAYSLVGRSRNRGKADYCPEDDHRHFLYQEYLRVIQKTRPAVFVMENVKGILSSKVNGRRIFHDILRDLVDPDVALNGTKGALNSCYRIHSLVAPTIFHREMDVEDIDPRDFIIRAEEYGIPQARHRVILLGIREDISSKVSPLTPSPAQVSVSEAIGDLPKLRSRLSKTDDLPVKWAETVTSHMVSLAADAKKKGLFPLSVALTRAAGSISFNLPSGGRITPAPDFFLADKSPLAKQLGDLRLRAILNHEARGHMSEDLRRYAYAATYASLYGASPKGHEQFNLRGLTPKHANWETGKFADRFRVQLQNSPATTVTSHISKDGHYFIHPDPAQCRSLTVREAARLQTFPDNYFFQGNRTQQFHQVGNAVPPLLAARIARVVRNVLNLS
jgi:DNA (cytosine-5)-methyltransferase 1